MYTIHIQASYCTLEVDVKGGKELKFLQTKLLSLSMQNWEKLKQQFEKVLQRKGEPATSTLERTYVQSLHQHLRLRHDPPQPRCNLQEQQNQHQTYLSRHYNRCSSLYLSIYFCTCNLQLSTGLHIGNLFYFTELFPCASLPGLVIVTSCPKWVPSFQISLLESRRFAFPVM